MSLIINPFTAYADTYEQLPVRYKRLYNHIQAAEMADWMIKFVKVAVANGADESNLKHHDSAVVQRELERQGANVKMWAALDKAKQDSNRKWQKILQTEFAKNGCDIVEIDRAAGTEKVLNVDDMKPLSIKNLN